jgi:hypothetical protein
MVSVATFSANTDDIAESGIKTPKNQYIYIYMINSRI